MNSSRRDLIKTGLISVSAFGGIALAQEAFARPVKADAKILNIALFYEHQAIWAYGFAAPKLSDSAVGKAVLEVALANQADHKAHRDTLAKVIRSLGDTPVAPKSEYLDTVKPYIERGEGNLDSDVNIAKLALALEVDAAIAYAKEAAQLKTPALITAGASIGANESAHATVIRSAFKSLGVDLKVIPAALITPENRNMWVVKV